MELPRILLIGKIGQVGWELRRTLAPMAQVTCVDFPEIDLTSGDSIRRWVRESGPNILLNAAAYTAVDKAESEPEKAMQINGMARAFWRRRPGGPARCWCIIPPTTFSTAPRPCPTSRRIPRTRWAPMAVLKLAGDEAIRAVGGAHLIFRLCWVYGARGQNFYAYHHAPGARAREAAHSGRPARLPDLVAHDRGDYGSGVEANSGGGRLSAFSGTYHLAASGVTSWHGFAQAIINRMSGRKEMRRGRSHLDCGVSDATRRPACSVLACDKLQRTFGLQSAALGGESQPVLER